jgi:hypothetical protein
MNPSSDAMRLVLKRYKAGKHRQRRHPAYARADTSARAPPGPPPGLTGLRDTLDQPEPQEIHAIRLAWEDAEELAA